LAPKPANLRAVAAEVICRVVQQQSLSEVLPLLTAALPDSEQPLCREISYGSLRWYYRLQAIVNSLLAKPLKKKERLVNCLLISALYQLVYMKKPDYAVVSGTVDALQALNKGWAKKLVNGVLRNFLRRQAEILETVDKHQYQALAHPQWLFQKLYQDWSDIPQPLSNMLSSNNQHPPLWCRINQMKTDPKAYRDVLREHHIHFEQFDPQSSAICLNPMPVDKIPGFSRGMISVQDAAAQFAAQLLQTRQGMTVLDVCAAPGGKTAHLLESARNQLNLTALDVHPERVKRIHENLQRLQLSAQVLCADALDTDTWWDGNCYDRILLDAPCSASGVIRRHPDIKLLRQADDIAALADLQKQFLDTIWPLLKPGGLLLYATCSVLRDENDRQVSAFLASTSDAREVPFSLPFGRKMPSGWQILSGEGNLDGFYYALLKKADKD